MFKVLVVGGADFGPTKNCQRKFYVGLLDGPISTRSSANTISTVGQLQYNGGPT
jgi:hypothetical protein